MSTDRAHARTTDPSTSHQAAASLTPLTLTGNRLAVLRLMSKCIVVHDEELVREYQKRSRDHARRYPRQSPSGIRTRRHELTCVGYVQRCGVTMVRGRQHLRWQITLAGRDVLARMGG